MVVEVHVLLVEPFDVVGVVVILAIAVAGIVMMVVVFLT